MGVSIQAFGGRRPAEAEGLGMDIKLGQKIFMDEKIPRHESEKGFVSVTEKSLMWRHKGSTIFTFQGPTTNK